MYGIVRLSFSRRPEGSGPVRNLLYAFILYHKKKTAISTPVKPVKNSYLLIRVHKKTAERAGGFLIKIN